MRDAVGFVACDLRPFLDAVVQPDWMSAVLA
jgi:hypothetical protein